MNEASFLETLGIMVVTCGVLLVVARKLGYDATVLDDLRALNVTFLIDSKQIGMTELTERIRTLGFTDTPQPR